jgi:hypothetical protein
MPRHMRPIDDGLIYLAFHRADQKRDRDSNHKFASDAPKSYPLITEPRQKLKKVLELMKVLAYK